jgi:hypothetical protein
MLLLGRAGGRIHLDATLFDTQTFAPTAGPVLVSMCDNVGGQAIVTSLLSSQTEAAALMGGHFGMSQARSPNYVTQTHTAIFFTATMFHLFCSATLWNSAAAVLREHADDRTTTACDCLQLRLWLHPSSLFIFHELKLGIYFACKSIVLVRIIICG